MPDYINILAAVASVLAIGDFLFAKMKVPHKIIIMVLAIGCGYFAYSYVQISSIEAAEQAKELALENALIDDAKSVSTSIDIYGGEDAGEYLGYLSQISGFYSRHKHKFETEYKMYFSELEGWQSYFRNKRENNQTIYGSEVNDLKGLVKSADGQLEAMIQARSEKLNNRVN